MRTQEMDSEINFVLNGEYVVVKNPDPKECLGDYLRHERGLKGLQMPCRQGGCGGCTVLLSSPQFQNGAGKTPVHRPINSCLRPLCSVDGMVVTTVEGVGSTRAGLHPVQQRLVDSNGTQCGFCSPGMVMSMYGLLQETPVPTQQQVENQIDGNLCRCTGYRPILDAFQTFSAESTNNKECQRSSGPCAAQSLTDIEDLSVKSGVCGGELTKLSISKNGCTWMRVTNMSQLYNVLRSNTRSGGARMVRGNTSTGIYPPPRAKILVDISRLSQLMKTTISESGITIGGAVPITDLMVLLKENVHLSPNYAQLVKHMERVAHPQVRNVGSVAGNLAVTHAHGEFPSDIATILMAAKARLKLAVADAYGLEKTVCLTAFFKMSIENMVILEIHIPIAAAGTQFRSYKVALRRVNAHALLNGAFEFKLEVSTGVCISSPVIVYGGVRPYPQRARRTEAYLKGKCCYNREVLDSAFDILSTELTIDPSLGRNEFRAALVGSFFYKAMISLMPDGSIPPRLRSAVLVDERAISSGQVSFDEGDPAEYPVSKPVPKISARLQVTGEAVYLDDIDVAGELHATFVTAEVANAAIKEIDASKALAKKGVVAFLSATSIAADGYCNLVSEYEEVFALNRVKFYGQPVGLVIATSKEIADAAAKVVDVQYTDRQAPILTIKDAVSQNSFFDERGVNFQAGSPEEALKDADVVVEDQVSTGHQYHFHLETQRALCVPGEDNSIKVYSSTQNPALIQHCVGVGLNKPQHKVEVVVKRVGGAFGGKMTRSSSVAMACAFAADKLQKPVRLLLDLSTNMQSVGSRSPYSCKYKIGARKDGRIQVVCLEILQNMGAHFDFQYSHLSNLVAWMDNCYNIPNWNLQGKVVKTNLPAMTFMRGPGFTELLLMIETAIEHMASRLQICPDITREVNMYVDGDITPSGQKLANCNAKLVLETVKQSSSYQQRVKDVEKFNTLNKWVKRGISIVPIKYIAEWYKKRHTALVNIYPDGSISIHTSGCEIGQGLDTKIAQVAAMVLGSLVKGEISADDIRVITPISVIANNTSATGTSATSELAAAAVQDACQHIAVQLQGIVNRLRTENGELPSWGELVNGALEAGADLQARGHFLPGPPKSGPFQYVSFGAAATEVEVDNLTGEMKILQSDLLLDCGKSLNPAVDIGQVRGAYVQGLGYFLSEEFIFDNDTGELVSDGTWEYKPPSSKDIPLDFRASLLMNSGNPSGFLRSKFSGEPSYGMAVGVVFAIRQAITAARSEVGLNSWFELSSPLTVEKVLLASALQPYLFKCHE